MKHRGVWLTTLLILIVLGTACVAAGMVLMLRPAESPAEADTPTTPTTDTYPRADGTLTDAEKVALNTAIEETLLRPMLKITGYELKQAVYDTDNFSLPDKAAAFAWQALTQDRSVPRVYDYDENGEEVTGAMAVQEADYLAYYSKLYGGKADTAGLFAAYPGYVLQDGTIFGSIVTGWGLPHFVLKATSFSSEDNALTLKMDLLTVFVERDGELRVDHDFIIEKMAPEVLDYPAESVYAQVTLQLTRTKEGYTADHLYIVKPT